jgi:BlaI family transcriptional regulator, penicillinase repressor
MHQEEQNQPPELSRLEMDVMNVVWRLGDCTSAEVIREYRKARSLAETTIRTVLANLRKKGFVELVPTTERGFRFRAAVSRESEARRTIRWLVSRLFEGSPRQAIQYLLKDEDINAEDLAELRRMLDAYRKGTSK